MKYIVLLLILVSCGPTKEEMIKDGTFINSRTIYNNRTSYDFTILTIDSCEYIFVQYNGISIIHKANCKNHR